MTSVLLLSLSSLRRDPRLLRQISLLRKDYEVFTAGYGEAPDGVKGHYRIPDELRAWRRDYRRFYALSSMRAFSRLYFGAPWVRHLLSVIPPGSFDVILANDANAAPLARRLAPRLGWHADLHEYATRQGEDNPTWRRFTRPVNTWMVRHNVSQADSATTVSPGLAAAYRDEFGIDCEVVPNTAPYRPDLEPRPTSTTGPLRLVYAGATVSSRRLERMIDAVGQVEAQSPGALVFDLYLMRADPVYRRQLEQHAGAAGPAVRLLDPVPFDELISTMSQYDVGFYACPPTNFNQEHALPNKLFEFVQARLAVVSGPSADMAPCVREHGFGVVARGFEVDDLAAALRGLTAKEVDQYKKAAHHAARALSSERTSKPWVMAIDRIAGKGHHADPSSTFPDPAL